MIPQGQLAKGFLSEATDAKFNGDVPINDQLHSLGTHNALSAPGSFISEPSFAKANAESSPTNTSTPQSFSGDHNYANRTASKATVALARFGKALYGSSNQVLTTPTTSFTTQDTSSTERNIKKNSISFAARSEIVAMGPSPTENAVAIAGKDCKLIALFLPSSNFPSFSGSPN